MAAGKLASVRPAASTGTFLYRCPIDKATSSVLSIVNTASTAVNYRLGLRDYDQTLTMDSTTYSFQKGNVVSGYKLEITPGINATTLTPGDLITSEDNKVSFKYLDIFKPTSTVTVPVQVAYIGDLDLDTSTGDFSDGDTITGDDTGLSATVYRFTDLPLAMKLEIAGISNSSTSFVVSDNTVLANDYLYFDDTSELVTVSSITDYTPTVTRGSLGTTATAHDAGEPLLVLRPSATSTTLSANVTDTVGTTISLTDAMGFTIGQYIKINTEIVKIDVVAGNNLTVTRGAAGTTASTHTSGDTATLVTDEGYVVLNYFADGESITGPAGTAVVSTYLPNTNPFNQVRVFTYDFDSDGNFSYPNSFGLNIDRTYRFTQEDASNSGHPLRFSTSQDGTDYSTGVTINGTPGTAGSYIEIVVDSDTATSLYTKCSVHTLMGISGTVNISPLYTEIYVYDIDGVFTNSETSFDTPNGLNTVTDTTVDAYGYVHDYTGAILRVSLGLNSQAFDTSSTFYDSPRTPNEDRTLCVVNIASSTTTISNPDFVAYDVTVDPNTTTQITALIVGPGQSLVVYASNATTNFVLNGFEDSTTDFSIVHYSREVSSGGGGGIITP